MLAREPVQPEPRRAMTSARKARIHASRNGVCWLCGKPVPVSGPDVRFDHKLPLELGGSDDDANIWPIHREPCDRLKTQADAKRIAKMRRQARMQEPKAPSRLRSRGFNKSITRRFDGTVVPRAAANKGAGE